ncbi:MAG: response regulator [Gammaproteobacteria bacterium]|nr:response regulator [Gammaproteobacteria bacterium]
MDKQIKVLIVDDAAFMVKAVREIMEADNGIEVIGSARNGQEGLEMIKQLKPDVITLDVDMPVMDGIRAVRHIMIESPVPIVMLSSLSAHGEITFEALRLGVVDFLPKPSGAISRDIHRSRNEIIDRVKIAASVVMRNIHRVKLGHYDVKSDLADRYGFKSLEYIIVVGTTLGGPNTVINLMSKLSPNLPAAVVAVQEISPKILPGFVKKFDEHTPWRIEAAEEGTILEQGSCYICSHDDPFVIGMNGGDGAFLKGNNGSERPLDELFGSAADVFEQNAIGVLLTGIGDDGKNGFSSVKQKFGVTIAQDTETCVYPNLTQCAIESGVVDHVVDVNNLHLQIESIIDSRNEEND